jgi:hypothetical protein
LNKINISECQDGTNEKFVKPNESGLWHSEKWIQTTNYAKHANENKKLFRVFGVFRG